MSHGPADAGAIGPDDPAEDDLTLTLPRVSEEDRRPALSSPAEASERDWPDDDLASIDGRRDGKFASSLATGLAAVPYLRAAIRRRARLWLVTALIGLILGLGLITLKPPGGKAQTQIQIAQPPNVNTQDAVLTDVALLQSRSLAQVALKRLHLTENVDSFMASYTVVSLTDQVLEIIVSAPTSIDAVQRANGIAAAYLQYRASVIELQRHATIVKLDAELTQARQRIAMLDGQITAESGQPPSPARDAKLNELHSERSGDENSLNGQLEPAASAYEVSSELAYDQEVSGSRELYPASALPPSKYKKPDVYAVGGLLAGLVLGMAYVAAAALMTDRLRRRDDVALAVGAPVRLSIGPLRLGRAGKRGRLSLAKALEVAAGIDVQRMAAQLRAAVPESDGGAATLAVIAMDDPYAAVLPILGLALGAVRQGAQVIIADLSADATAGRLLGFADPGVRIVLADGEQIALVVPEPGDLLAIGPLPDESHPAQPTGAVAGRGGRSRASRVGGQLSGVQTTTSYQLAAAYESADMLLTVVTLDPALGAEHLPTWATDAVIVVTAGESTATKIHSISEMARLAGTTVRCVLLVGADKNDESIGTVPAPTVSYAGVSEDSMPAEADVTLADSRPDDRRS